MAPSPSPSPSTPPNQIYQYSLLNALMSGVCTEGIPASQLLTHGDHGLGTFRDMNGELVLVDSQIYHFHADGTVSRADPDERIPFAMVTRFVPQHSLRAQALRDKQSLQAILNTVIPKTDNSFVAYRLHGRWKDMHVRMIRGRQYAGQKLSELHASQVEYTYHDVTGTVVGFRAPRSWQGVTVAGHHLHFLSEDERLGGHVLQLSSGEGGVDVGVSVVSDVHVELPRGEEFQEAELEVDDEGIKRVEG